MPATATQLNEIQTKLEDRVLEWTERLCVTLEKNYEDYHRNMITNNSLRFSQGDTVLGVREDLSDYAKQQLAEMDNGTAKLMKFRIQSGKKYYKIIQQNFDTFQDRNEYRDGSVHAFVNKKTGEVYKPAGWAKPAKHVRYDMRIINDRVKLHTPRFTDWAGGYLYLR